MGRRTARALAGLALALVGAAAEAGTLEIEKAVLLSRHGIRSPLADNAALDRLSASPWPAWSVPPGHLTPHGAAAVTRLGAYYRTLYAGRGLLPADGCPADGAVTVWADAEQRTIATGDALIAGLAPGCGVATGHLPLGSADPLIAPVKAGLCPLEGSAVQRAILGRVGGDLARLADAYADEIAAVQTVLGCPAAAGAPACGIAGASTVAADGKLEGPVATGHAVAENFLLEYVEGKPAAEVGFGRIDLAAIDRVGRLYTVFYDLTARTPTIAARQGSNLVARILADLRQAAEAASPAVGPRLAIYVAHDSTISHVAGLLGLDWALPGYQPNQTPPAGALAFELLRDRDTGARSVGIAFYTQTPDQMRDLTPLTPAAPPIRAAIALPRCPVLEGGLACPWAPFARTLDAALDPECVTR